MSEAQIMKVSGRGRREWHGYQVLARKKTMGTDGHRVPAKFSIMPTTGFRFEDFQFSRIFNREFNRKDMYQTFI